MSRALVDDPISAPGRPGCHRLTTPFLPPRKTTTVLFLQRTRRATVSSRSTPSREQRTIPFNVLPSSSVLPALVRLFESSLSGSLTLSMTCLSRSTASRYAASAPATSLLLSISTAFCARSSAVCSRCREGVLGTLGRASDELP